MTKKELMMLDTLDTQFKKLERIPLDAIPKLAEIIHRAPNDALLAMVKRHIRFCDTVANTELVERGILPTSAKMDHAIDVLMANHA
jgi:hypothetical protein